MGERAERLSERPRHAHKYGVVSSLRILQGPRPARSDIQAAFDLGAGMSKDCLPLEYIGTRGFRGIRKGTPCPETPCWPSWRNTRTCPVLPAWLCKSSRKPAGRTVRSARL